MTEPKTNKRSLSDNFVPTPIMDLPKIVYIIKMDVPKADNTQPTQAEKDKWQWNPNNVTIRDADEEEKNYGK